MVEVGDSTGRAPALAGLRILVVEDVALVAIEVRNILQRAGCQVVGPFGRLAGAMEAVGQHGNALDGALLDVNVHGEDVYPLAEALGALGVPFIFMSGYGSESIPRSVRRLPRLQKPFESSELLERMVEVFAPAGEVPSPSPAPLRPLSAPLFHD